MITQVLLENSLTRPNLRKEPSSHTIRKHKAVVIHWTANKAPGANAMANRNYFNNGCPGPNGSTRAASAHYLVDSDGVIQCLPTNEVGFHVGDKPMGRYKQAGIDMIGTSNLTPNYFTIGVEMCVNEGGNWNKTVDNTVTLAARELVRYGLNIDTGLLRHFDVTGKLCPAMYIDPRAWAEFKAEVSKEMQFLETKKLFRGFCNTAKTNVRNAPGMSGAIIGQLYLYEPVFATEQKGDWVEVWPGGFVHTRLITKD